MAEIVLIWFKPSMAYGINVLAFLCRNFNEDLPVRLLSLAIPRWTSSRVSVLIVGTLY